MSNLDHVEFARKYAHTTALLSCKVLNLNRVGVFFQEIYNTDRDNGENGEWFASFTDAEGKRYTCGVQEITVSEVPMRQMFDYAGRSYEFSRVPERQWQKGLTRQNTGIYDTMVGLLPHSGELQPLKVRLITTATEVYNLDISPDIINRLFDTYETRTLEQAIAYIDHTNVISICLDKMYVLAVHPSLDNKYLLLRYSKPIGIVHDAEHITPILPIFTQEVEDCRVRYQ